MNNILLVGATGFLGSLIRDYYLDKGCVVVTFGRSPDSDIITDFSDNINYKELMEYSFDTIIHCAAINETKINDSINNTYRVNVTLTRLLLEIAIKCDVKNFIYLSTFHVYGKSTGYIDEITGINPLNDYGLTHFLSEQLIENLCNKNDINYLLVRPINIYGLPSPNSVFDRWSLVPFEFIKMAKNDNEIVLQSTGEQLRNFVSVSDVIKSFNLLGQQNVVNAYGADTLSIYDFACLVSDMYEKVTNQPVSIKRVNPKTESKHDDLQVGNSFPSYNPNENDLNAYLIKMINKVD